MKNKLALIYSERDCAELSQSNSDRCIQLHLDVLSRSLSNNGCNVNYCLSSVFDFGETIHVDAHDTKSANTAQLSFKELGKRIVSIRLNRGDLEDLEIIYPAQY